MAIQGGSAQRKDETAYMTKRNPYLVDFETQRKRRQQVKHKPAIDSGLQIVRAVSEDEGIPVRERTRELRRDRGQYERPESREPRRVRGQYESPESREPRRVREQYVRPESHELRRVREQGRRNPGAGRTAAADREIKMNLAPRRQLSRQAVRLRRRRQALFQRALVSIWVLCILVLGAAFIYKNTRVSAGEGGQGAGALPSGNQVESPQYSGVMVQGIPAEEYAKHPDWTEDFLTPNEYSRPGDALKEVNNIFVHYTANPGTSAAQNRSYFEWLKDTHETSASAHFIIGYEGEIIQCIPLDEIAYAVQTRNEDSISIECCYLEEDGSFTQETYNSLLSLLAWLKDAYHLDTEDILRHYDCGGKKCPLYYTENPDAWEELKNDVDKL